MINEWNSMKAPFAESFTLKGDDPKGKHSRTFIEVDFPGVSFYTCRNWRSEYTWVKGNIVAGMKEAIVRQLVSVTYF